MKRFTEACLAVVAQFRDRARKWIELNGIPELDPGAVLHKAVALSGLLNQLQDDAEKADEQPDPRLELVFARPDVAWDEVFQAQRHDLGQALALPAPAPKGTGDSGELAKLLKDAAVAGATDARSRLSHAVDLAENKAFLRQEIFAGRTVIYSREGLASELTMEIAAIGRLGAAAPEVISRFVPLLQQRLVELESAKKGKRGRTKVEKPTYLPEVVECCLALHLAMNEAGQWAALKADTSTHDEFARILDPKKKPRGKSDGGKAGTGGGTPPSDGGGKDGPK